MIAVVIPSYRVTRHILDVIEQIGPEVGAIYVVDDACPDGSGQYVLERCRDSRVHVIFHAVNCGVGGAVISGYRQAVADGASIVVKIDGDGQMDPRLIRHFVAPILDGEADYTKGNRFFEPRSIKAMPTLRLIGNSALSFLCKMSSGYWSVFDPTNGYTAIHANVIMALPLDRIAKRWFFESDMLFRLSTLGCRVIDIPMVAVYSDEISNLNVRRVVFAFATAHLQNTMKRIVYQYFLRNFSVASLELLFGTTFLAFGLMFGGWEWFISSAAGRFASSGEVMLGALPTIMGAQLLLAFLVQDIGGQPSSAIHRRLAAVVEIRRQLETGEHSDKAAPNIVRLVSVADGDVKSPPLSSVK